MVTIMRTTSRLRELPITWLPLIERWLDARARERAYAKQTRVFHGLRQLASVPLITVLKQGRSATARCGNYTLAISPGHATEAGLLLRDGQTIALDAIAAIRLTDGSTVAGTDVATVIARRDYSPALTVNDDRAPDDIMTGDE